MPTKCSGQPSGVFAARDPIVLDPSNTQMKSYSEMRRTFLAYGESISKIFQTESLSHHRTRMRYILGSKTPALHPKSSKWSKHWRLQLQIAIKSDLKCSRVIWVTCQVAWCSGRTPKNWLRWSSQCTTMGTGENAPNTVTSLLFAWLGKCVPVPWKKMPRNIEAKLEDMQCGLRPGRSTTDKIYTPQETFEKSLEQAKDMFCRHRENIRPGSL